MWNITNVKRYNLLGSVEKPYRLQGTAETAGLYLVSGGLAIRPQQARKPIGLSMAVGEDNEMQSQKQTQTVRLAKGTRNVTGGSSPVDELSGRQVVFWSGAQEYALWSGLERPEGTARAGCLLTSWLNLCDLRTERRLLMRSLSLSLSLSGSLMASPAPHTADCALCH